MDPTKFKDLKVKRGYNYHYYYSPAAPGKPTILFVHGFPSTSADWARQVAHLQPLGYGIVVPDCLGYGGSSKPADYKEYRHKLLSHDFVEILDAEGIQSAIAIGHDWGSALVSRLANWHPERFTAFAWVALAYTPASTDPLNLEQLLGVLKAKLGSEMYGYWGFFARPDAPDVVAKNIDSFIDIIYPKDAEAWKHWLAPTGKIEEWVSTGRRTERPDWVSAEEYAVVRETFVQHGLGAPMNYYKTMVFDLNLEDNKELPEEHTRITKPSLFVAATKDQVCRADIGKMTMKQFAPGAEIVDIDAGHWVQLEATAQLNQVLEKWLGGLSSSSSL